MPKRKLVTTQDKQRRKTTTDFVGRQSQLRDFKLNLSLDPGDGNFQMVWNVFGQGGVGKSTLLKQFVRQAEAAGYALAQVDVEDPKMREVTAVLASIAEQFQEADFNTKDFQKRYEDYQQAKGKIAKDPDKPGGLAKDLVSGGLRTAGKIGAEFVPGGNILLEALPFDKLTDKAGEWTSYLFKTLKNDDDVKLVQDPLAVLTPLLLAPLREAWEDGRNFAILLDTYETHAPELDDWLLRFLRGDYGDVPIFPFVIAGRDPLESSAWRDLDLVRQLELNAFTPAETNNYLSQRAFTSLEERERIHTLTGGLPVFVSMIADAGPGGDYKEGEAQDRVVERFLKHIADPVQRTLALRAALVNHLNQDVVGVLLEEADRPRAAELFTWLKSRPFVQRRAGDWAYHPIVRDVMRLHQRAISPATFTGLHKRMADYYGGLRQTIQGDAEEPPFGDVTYRGYAEEHAFHLLWASYQQNLTEVIEILATGVSSKYLSRPIIDYLESVEETYLGKLDWADTWLKPIKDKEYFLPLAKRINALNCLKSPAVAAHWWIIQGELELEQENMIACYQRVVEIKPDYYEAYSKMGNAYGNQGDYAAAIASFQRAVEIKPDYHEAYYNMGVTYGNQGDYAAAIGSYQRAVEIKPDYHVAYQNMGVDYGNQGDYAAAIGSYQRAVEIKPDYHVAYQNMGVTYGNQGDYAAAIGSYQRAVEIKPDDHETYYNMGVTYDNQGDYAAAIASYQRAVEIKPNYHAAYQNMGVDYGNQGDYAAAIASFQRAVEIKPDDHETYYNMGVTYDNQGDYAAAIASFQRAVEIKPDYHVAYQNMGVDYGNQGDYAAAIGSYQRAVEIKPDDHETYYIMGVTYDNQGDYAAAIASYQRAVEIKPDYHAAYQNMGVDYGNQGDYAAAIGSYQRAVEIKPDMHAAYYSMGIAYSKLGDYPAAIASYQRAVEIKPDYHAAYQNMGVDYDNQGDYAAAIASYQRAVEIKPDMHAAYYSMGIAYSKLGDYPAAIGSYQRAVEIKPDDHAAYQNMGVDYGNQGDYAAAIGSYQRAVEIKPDYNEAYYNMGVTYGNQGDYAAAIGSYQRAVEIKPDYNEAYYNMGFTYGNQGDYAAAIGSYQRAVEIKPDYHAAYYNMGIAYSKLGDYPAAIGSYQRAVEIKPDYHAAYYNMGIAYSKLGDYPAAIGSYQRAVEIKPDMHAAHHNLGWIYLLQHRFELADAAFAKCWDLSAGQYETAAMNLGHVKLLTGDTNAARTWYQSSLPLWENPDIFYNGMASDYEELRMAELGIKRKDYEALWKP